MAEIINPFANTGRDTGCTLTSEANTEIQVLQSQIRKEV